MRAELRSLLNRVGIEPCNDRLYEEATTHSSYVHEHSGKNLVSNERLEFLGDAVIQLVVTEFLYREYPSIPEGDLTRARAAVVSAPTLSRKAQDLGVGDVLLLGRGEEATGGRSRASNLENALEAMAAAVYLDLGLEAARAFIMGVLEEEVRRAVRGSYTHDWKTLLQERLQRQGCFPEYRVTDESGPDHAKTFEVVVMVGGTEIGRGRGRSKKEAEQSAARMALAALDREGILAHFD